MQSLSSSSTQLSFSNSQKPLSEEGSFKKAPLKTENFQIFPSLHPCSSFYAKKQPVNHNTSMKLQMEPAEPVKKVKVDNLSQELIINKDKSEPKQKTLVKSSDDYVFRVPKLPKRLEKKPSVMKQNSTKVEVSAIPQIVTENLKDCYLNPKVESLRKLNVQTQAHKLFSAIESLNVKTALNPLILAALYKKLQLEFLSIELSQNQDLMRAFQRSLTKPVNCVIGE